MKVNSSSKPIIFGNNGVANMEETFDSTVKNLIKKLLESAEEGISEFGVFPEVKQTLANPEKNSLIEEISLRVAPFTDPKIPNHKTMRYLETVVKNRKTGQIGRQAIEVGSKEAIINVLKSDSIEKSVKEAAERILKIMAR